MQRKDKEKKSNVREPRYTLFQIRNLWPSLRIVNTFLGKIVSFFSYKSVGMYACVHACHVLRCVFRIIQWSTAYGILMHVFRNYRELCERRDGKWDMDAIWHENAEKER